MRGKNEVRLLGDAELAGEIVAALGQLLGLGPEQNGIDDHTVADDIGLATLENPRRNRAQDVLLTVELKRMAGIGTALETRYDLVAGRQYIHDLALALVAPLQTEDHVDFFHYELMTVFFGRKRRFLHSKIQKTVCKNKRNSILPRPNLTDRRAICDSDLRKIPWACAESTANPLANRAAEQKNSCSQKSNFRQMLGRSARRSRTREGCRPTDSNRGTQGRCPYHSRNPA